MAWNHHPEACGWRRQRTRASVVGQYNEQQSGAGTRTIGRNYEGNFQHLAYVPGNRFYISGNATYFSNNSLAIHLQQVYRLGAGTEFDVGNLGAEIDLGPAWVHQDFTDTSSTQSFTGGEADARFDLSITPTGAGGDFSGAVSVLLPFNGTSRWQLKSFVGLYAPLSSRLRLTIKAYYDFLARTPPGSEPNYFTTTIGISASMGR